jgi:hypothetical protein
MTGVATRRGVREERRGRSAAAEAQRAAEIPGRKHEQSTFRAPEEGRAKVPIFSLL